MRRIARIVILTVLTTGAVFAATASAWADPLLHYHL